MSTNIKIRSCEEKGFFAYGTHKIFNRRANKLHAYRSWITFLGIAGPLAVGAIVLMPEIKLNEYPFVSLFWHLRCGAAAVVGIFIGF